MYTKLAVVGLPARIPAPLMFAPPVTLLATTMSLSFTVNVCTLNMVSVPKTLRLPEIVALLLIRRLPPVMLPVALSVPAMLAPVSVTVMTLAVPAADMVTLPLRKVRTLAVPFCMAVASIPVSWLPLPMK